MQLSDMPVTAKLSRKFYEKLGEDVTNELVEWFNSVDATYRDNLRELNESNFVRVNGRLGEFNATWEGRFIALEAKLEQRMAESDAKWEHRIAELRTELVKELADVKGGLKWMYAFWAPTALAVIGTGAGVIGLLLRR